MARISKEDIIKKVEAHENATDGLRQRFENDWAFYQLEEHLPVDPNRPDENVGFKIYTSSGPQVFVDKLIAWGASAKLFMHIPEHGELPHQRDVDNSKENFYYGMIEANDERLTNLGQPKLQEQLFAFSTVRGPICGRAMFMKPKGAPQYVDISPWDPLHVYWGFGKKGLEWVCHKTSYTKAEIKANWGVNIDGKNPDDDKEPIDVYDFYDTEINKVVVDGKTLKKATPHGSPGVPAFFQASGSMPAIKSRNTGQSSFMDSFSESALKSIRDGYRMFNFAMSIFTELVSRARDSSFTTTSEHGEKQVGVNPWINRQEIQLAGGEKIEVLPNMEMVGNTMEYIGIIVGEIQRASLPHTAYGELAQALSGFAITQLRKGIDTQIGPRMTHVAKAIKQICTLLSDQYATGAFDTVSLSGFGNDRKYFSMEITPEVVKAGCQPQVELIGDLPEDMNAKIVAAQMMREGPDGVPLASDRYIRTEHMKWQNNDNIEKELWEQKAERASPVAVLWNLFENAMVQGQYKIAYIYLRDLQIMAQQQMATLTSGAPVGNVGGDELGGGNGVGPSAGGAGPTLNPQVLPEAALGASPPPPDPRIVGPFVPPGTPRPGAQQPPLGA